jgi:hypothetical protein
VVHLFSTALEALFCTGCVMLVYQLCLRWFGRERLEGLMTIAQVIVSVGTVMASQILPQMVMRIDRVLNVSEIKWWIDLLPPAWFAGLDDALAGSAMFGSWVLAALAVGATTLVSWIAFHKLARDYTIGLQTLNETVSTGAKNRNRRRLLDWLVSHPPLSWWLRDPVARASFLLTAAYLVRDRDVKLRIYPSIASVLIIPVVFLLRDRSGSNSTLSGFSIAFAGAYLGMAPMLGLQMLQYSQQWQAADIFRAAPLPGPAALCHGARRAVLCLLVMPTTAILGVTVCLLHGNISRLALLLPGIIALPVIALFASLVGHAVPLSLPPDSSQSASRGLKMIAVMIIVLPLAGLASFSWSRGWFGWLILGEVIVAAGAYFAMRLTLAKAPWPTME